MKISFSLNYQVKEGNSQFEEQACELGCIETLTVLSTEPNLIYPFTVSLDPPTWPLPFTGIPFVLDHPVNTLF